MRVSTLSVAARSLLASPRATSRGFISVRPSSACAAVSPLPILFDNYCYLLFDRISRVAAVVDPGEAAPVISSVKNMEKEFNVKLKTIFCTHKHHDHIGGVAELKSQFKDVEVVGTKYEDIPELDRGMGHGDVYNFGSLRVEALHTPCHTAGHVCFYITSEQDSSMDPILFSGDTLFVGGCGRFFEGEPQDMLQNMNLLGKLPTSTQVYCGHEYTVSNITFIRSIAAKMEMSAAILSDIDEYYTRACKLRKGSSPTVPTTIGDELVYNLFMKCNDGSLQSAMNCPKDPVGVMAHLRHLKNLN